jgi:hypothetical protein
MLTFFGFELELFVDQVLDGQDPLMHSARDFRGEHWLIIQVDDDPEHLVWVCAPISVRALRSVTAGQASPRDAVRHSLTGNVEIVTVDRGRAVPDRCLRCAVIPESLLPDPELRVLVAA